MEHQDVFSKAGIISPSYWFSDTVWTFVQETGNQEEMRLYQMTGENEGGAQVPFTLFMHDSLLSIGFDEDEIHTIIVPNGQHNEQLWRTQFKEAYLWLFAVYIATSVEEIQGHKTLIIYPNPVNNKLYISAKHPNIKASLKLMSIAGKTVLEHDNHIGNWIDVSDLKPGSYIVYLESADAVYRGKFIKN